MNSKDALRDAVVAAKKGPLTETSGPADQRISSYLPFGFGALGFEGLPRGSITVVLGRRNASRTGMYCPVPASRPIFPFVGFVVIGTF